MCHCDPVHFTRVTGSAVTWNTSRTHEGQHLGIETYTSCINHNNNDEVIGEVRRRKLEQRIPQEGGGDGGEGGKGRGGGGGGGGGAEEKINLKQKTRSKTVLE